MMNNSCVLIHHGDCNYNNYLTQYQYDYFERPDQTITSQSVSLDTWYKLTL